MLEIYELNIGYVIIVCVVIDGLEKVVSDMKCLMIEVRF